jgi:hypothetical protein
MIQSHHLDNPEIKETKSQPSNEDLYTSNEEENPPQEDSIPPLLGTDPVKLIRLSIDLMCGTRHVQAEVTERGFDPNSVVRLKERWGLNQI